jgi:AmpE protein
MNFLVALAAIIIEFTLAGVVSLRSPHWSGAWAARLAALCADLRWYRGWLGALLLIGLPVMAVQLVGDWLMGVSHLLFILASLGLLVWMLGPTDLNRELEEYRRSLLLDAEERAATTPAFTTTTAGIDFGPATGDAEFDACRAELAAVALAAERAWFAPLFWFFVGGPAGVVAYRLAASLERAPQVDSSMAAPLAFLHEALAFVPARITALSLGIAGTLVPVLEAAPAAGMFRWGASAALVARSALAATDDGRVREGSGDDAHLARLHQMRALVRRALNVWIVLLAVLAVS